MALLKQWDGFLERRIADAPRMSGIGTVGINCAHAKGSRTLLRIRKTIETGYECLASSMKARIILCMILSAIAHAFLLFAPWTETQIPVVKADDTVDVTLVDEMIPVPISADGNLPEIDDPDANQESSSTSDYFAPYEPTKLKAVSCDALVGLYGRRSLGPMHLGRLRVNVPSGANIGACGFGNGGLFSLDQLDMLPRLRHGAKPYYPKNLLDAHIEGTVRLLVLLNTKGRVRVLQILQSDDPCFTDSAVHAAEQFVYDPPTHHGSPVNTKFTLPISFSIE